MQEYKIFTGSSHPSFAYLVSDYLEKPLGRMVSKKFSCGETYVRYDETFRGQDVFLIQTCRTNHMNDDLIELLLMIQSAKLSFANNVHVVLPYLAYSRQDKIHEPREGISARLFSDMIVAAGASHVITMHLHADQIQGFFNCPVDNLNSRNLFTQYIESKNISDAVIVSPDAGGAKDAKKFADGLGVPLVILHKQRPEHNQSEVTHVVGEIKGKTPIIFDDMVDTAGSVVGAVKALRNAGCNPEVYLCVTHPIFSGKARENLDRCNFSEIITTDTLPVEDPPRNFHVLSTAPLFAEVIRNVIEKKSVSKLYF